MSEYTVEQFSNDAVAVQRDGLDIIHIVICYDDAKPRQRRATEAEFQQVVNAVIETVEGSA